jgi:hypothetical protein
LQHHLLPYLADKLLVCEFLELLYIHLLALHQLLRKGHLPAKHSIKQKADTAATALELHITTRHTSSV